MTTILQGPYPNVQTSTVLPNPQLADIENCDIKINIKRSMTGKKRTYVQGGGKRKLSYNFNLTRQKGLELRAFILAYSGSQILLTNYLEETWVVYLMNNPFEFTSSARGAPAGDLVTIKLDFEGIKL